MLNLWIVGRWDTDHLPPVTGFSLSPISITKIPGSWQDLQALRYYHHQSATGWELAGLLYSKSRSIAILQLPNHCGCLPELSDTSTQWKTVRRSSGNDLLRPTLKIYKILRRALLPTTEQSNVTLKEIQEQNWILLQQQPHRTLLQSKIKYHFSDYYSVHFHNALLSIRCCLGLHEQCSRRTQLSRQTRVVHLPKQQRLPSLLSCCSTRASFNHCRCRLYVNAIKILPLPTFLLTNIKGNAAAAIVYNSSCPYELCCDSIATTKVNQTSIG